MHPHFSTNRLARPSSPPGNYTARSAKSTGGQFIQRYRGSQATSKIFTELLTFSGGLPLVEYISEYLTGEKSLLGNTGHGLSCS
jgi:hypothetical protein